MQTARAVAEVDRENAAPPVRLVRSVEQTAADAAAREIDEENARRAARLGPDAPPLPRHRPGCGCVRCDQRPFTCQVPGCTRVLIGRGRYSGHLTWHARAKKRAALVPDGHGYLKRVLVERPGTLNLGALRRFEDLLYPPGARRRPRLQRRLDRAFIAQAEEEPAGNAALRAPVTNAVAATIYRIAILAGVAPSTISTALVLYGMEKLAHDLKSSRAVTVPFIPRLGAEAVPDAQRTVPVQQSTAFFPDAEEYVTPCDD